MATTDHGIDRASGYVNYSSSGPNKFIPSFWGGPMVAKFYGTTIFGDIANTDYSGDISDMGDSVWINKTPDVAVNGYTIGQDLTYNTPESEAVLLNIDQGAEFSFAIDDVDAYQSKPDLMDVFTNDASEKMSTYIDKQVLGDIYSQVDSANASGSAGVKSGDIDLGEAGVPKLLDKSNAVDFLVDLNVVLDEQELPLMGRWVAIPPWMAGLIRKGDLKEARITGDETGVIRNGRIGEIDGLTVYKSTHLDSGIDTGSGKKVTNIVAGHKSGFTFASQMTRLQHLPNPNRFGLLVRGLNVYGYKVIEPKYLAHGLVAKG